MPGANNAIGTGAIVLSANADGVVAGLKQASALTSQWANGMPAKMSGAFGGGGFTSSIAGKIGGLAKSVFSPAGIAIGGALGAAAGMAMVSELQDISKQGAVASALGLNAEQFTGIAGLAKSVGEDSREFTESLVTLGKVASEGAAGAGNVAPQFFKDLNIDAQKFKSLRVDEQFFATFEALQKIEDPGTKVRQLMTAFGEDGGKYLLPLLSKTPEELKKMAGGFAITTAEMEKSQRATAAWASAEQSLGKLWRGVAIAAAPAIEVFAGAVSKLQPVFDWVGRYVSAVGDVAGRIFGKLSEWVSDAVGWVGDLAKEVGIFGESWPTVEQYVTAAFKALGIAGAYVWDTLKAGMGVFAVGIGVVVKGLSAMIGLFADVVATAKNLPAHLKPVGLDKFIKGVEDVRDGVHDAGDGISKWGDDAIAGWGKSADKVRAWFDKPITPVIKPVVAAPGTGAIAADTTPFKLSGAIEARTKEAYSLILKNTMRGDGLAGADVAKQHLAESKKQTAKLGEIAKGITKLTDEETV